MIKTLMLAIPNPNRNLTECQEYLGKSHPKTAMSVASLSNTFKRYTMNYALEASDGIIIPTLYRQESKFMMAVEICCESREAYELALTDKEYLKIVRPDEEYMIREIQGAAPIFYELQETEIFTNGAPRRNGEYKIFDFLQKRNDVNEADFFDALKAEGEALMSDNGFLSVVNCCIHNKVLGTTPLFGLPQGKGTAVVETRVDNLEALADFNKNSHKLKFDFADQEASFTIVTQQSVIRQYI